MTDELTDLIPEQDEIDQSRGRLFEFKRIPRTFRIDPKVAKAIRDDELRKDELRSKEQLNAAVEKELATVTERIIVNARSIALPAGYGWIHAWGDQLENDQLEFKRACSPPHYVLSPAEDAKNAQLVARFTAYSHSPEALAPDRIRELQDEFCRGED
jgi:hypothetical protein